MLLVAGFPHGLHQLAGRQREQCPDQVAAVVLDDQGQGHRQSSVLQTSPEVRAHQQLGQRPLAAGESVQQPPPALPVGDGLEVGLLDPVGRSGEQTPELGALLGARGAYARPDRPG